jgi:hypothetical protein
MPWYLSGDAVYPLMRRVDGHARRFAILGNATQGPKGCSHL